MTDKTDASKPTSEPPKNAKKPGYTNPALRAMGIRQLRLPSRNWMIFWAVVGGITGGIYYDRQKRKQVRQGYKDAVSYLGERPLGGLEIPRKVTVFVAPPPGDYLDHVLTHFRAYIKPILTAAALDYEVKQENRQGEIRYVVAEGIRNFRREQAGLPKVPSRLMIDEEEYNKEVAEQNAELERLKAGQEKHKNPNPTFQAFNSLTKKPEAEEKPEEMMSLSVAGTIAQEQLDKELASKLSFDPESGVICVGRGAYKEYLQGLHEGWLGPLEDPRPDDDSRKAFEEFPDRERDEDDALGLIKPETVPVQDISSVTSPVADISETTSESGNVSTVTDVVSTPAGPEDVVTESVPVAPIVYSEFKAQPVLTKDGQKKLLKDMQPSEFDPKCDIPTIKKKPVPKPYITPAEYSEAELSKYYASGFENASTAHSTVSSNINQQPNDLVSPAGSGTAFVEQFFFSPIAVIPHRHIMGFMNTPLRIARYFNKRAVADEVGAATVVAVTGDTRPFNMRTDPDLLVSEEYDWPAKWVKKGQDNGSEWVQPVVVDQRVMEKVKVYEPKGEGESELK
ncbi:Mitochondrial import inner membrane translocase subunit TIM54 [Yarrowia sp. B02]|nr:Mitochondrial import inner membrane translocase subunit TIM54 [Yarrowia sp. B02]